MQSYTVRYRVLTFVLPLLLFGAGAAAAQDGGYHMQLIAGTGDSAFSGDGGPALDAALSIPQAVAVAPDGTIYFADTANLRVRRITPDGTITTVAGSGEFGTEGDGGLATDAAFSDFLAIALDAAHNLLYVAEISNHRIRRIDLTTGLIDTFATYSPGTSDYQGVYGLAVDQAGNLYVSATWACQVMVFWATGGSETIAGADHAGPGPCPGTVEFLPPSNGDGNPAVDAFLLQPQGLAVDSAGNVFIADRGSTFGTDTDWVRRIDAASGIITTVAGGGTLPPANGTLATEANLGNSLLGIAIDDAPGGATRLFLVSGNQVLVADLGTGILSVLAGTGEFLGSACEGPATSFSFHGIYLNALGHGPAGEVIVADSAANRICAIVPDASSSVGHITHIDTDLAAIYAPPGVTSVTGDVTVVNNDVTTLIDLSGLDTVEGNVHISDNGVTTVIDLSGLDAVGGNVDISDNGATTLIDLSGLDTVGGNVNISDNGVTTVIDLGQVQHVGGDLKITNNDSATEIDLGQVRHLGGDLTVLNNGSATVTMPSGEVTVNGDVTIESTGSGTFSAMLCAAGSTDIEATGYATVVATTAQTGTTQVTSVDDSAIEITLQPGTFSGCTNFSLTRVAVSPDKGTDENGNPIVADVVGAYHIAFDVPTLGHPATLTFQIILANLSAALQNEVLDALNAGILHLVTQGDAPDAPYQVFPVCTAGQAPTDGGCVLLETLDADGNPTAASPAIVRFTGVVGHFSTWAVAIVTPIGAPAAIFNGLLQPYPAPPVTATPSFKRGRVVPVKFNWVDATGNVLDSATANPMILVLTANCEAQPGTTTAVTVDDPGESGWHYDAETRTWGFGWNTRKLGAGCYWLRMLTGAPEFQAPQQLFPIALH